jgi:sugar/nucleoside kinase (ribokinase family)
MTSVACVGLATRDTILAVPEQPPADGRVVATELVVAGGGPAATAAVTLARLGVDVAFFGVVGDDEAGAFVRAGLEEEGIDVSGLDVAAGKRTPQSVVLVGPGGTRSIVHRPGDGELAPVEPDADWVHVDHAGYGHARGRLSIDGGNPIPTLDLRGVALYAPTEERLRAEFGEAGAALAAGAETVVVTRGASGSVGYTRDGTVEAPPVPCAPVSTLGAGDVFHGALLAFLVRGAGLEEALRAANTAASLSCRALDGRSAIPTLDELKGAMT